MRFNERQLVEVSLGEPDLEGRLNYKKVPTVNINHVGKGFKERWFKLKSNMLFYFKLNDLGQIDLKEPAGVFILVNTSIQSELSADSAFAFSITFLDDPARKHLFCARSASNVTQWVDALKQANYEKMRSQLVVLQSEIKKRTGKDPLLTIPRNRGVVRDVFVLPVNKVELRSPARPAPLPPPVANLIDL